MQEISQLAIFVLLFTRSFPFFTRRKRLQFLAWCSHEALSQRAPGAQNEWKERSSLSSSSVQEGERARVH